MYQPDWAPSPSDVAAVLRARTKDTNGNELGTFTPSTRPTDAQVEDLIATAIADISGEVGDVPDIVQDNARRTAAIRAAMLVELSYFPEQINSGRSSYPQLEKMYAEQFVRFTRQVGEAKGGGELGDMGELPVSSFPTDGGGVVGWATGW